MIDEKYKELQNKYEGEQEHSAFLEKLLRALYGDGWNKLTIDDAKKCSVYKVTA